MYQVENSGDLLKNKRRHLSSRVNWLSVGRTVFLLGLTSLLTDISAEMVSTTLPIYLLVTLHFSPIQVGIIDGLYQGAAVFVKLISGIVSDRWRRPKEVAAAGYAFSAICKLGFLVVGGSWTGLSGVILLDRIGKGIRTAPRDAMIAASSTPEQMATAFGVHRALDTAGAMLGPLLAVTVLMLAPDAYDAVFVVSLCIAIIGLAVIALFVNNPTEPVNAPQGTISFQEVWRLLLQPHFRTLVIIGSGLALATVSDSLIYLTLQRRLLISNGAFPLLYVLTALVYMLLAIPAGRLADQVGRKRVFLIGYGLLGAVYGLLLLPQMNYVIATSLLLLLGLYYAATDGVLMAVASRILPEHLRATGLSVLTTGTGLARLLASTLYGALWSWYGASQALTLFTVGLLSMVVLAFLMIRQMDGKGVEHGAHA